MASTSQQRQWARLEDWEPHKEQIALLYWDQNRPLKEVAEIMRREHGFNATEKMYKARLKKWGLTKYLKAEKVRLAQTEADVGKITVPVVRGRFAGPRKLKRELNRRLPEQFAIHTASGTSSRTMSMVPRSQTRTLSPSPMATHIEAPGKFKHVESCLTAVLEYSKNRFQATKWDRGIDLFREDCSDMWQNKVLTGYSMIKNGKVKDGFRLIDICLKSYRSLILKEHPLLIIETYTTFLYLSLHRLDLAETIIRYLAGICRVCLGPMHPYSRIWTALMSLGMEQLRQAAALVIKTQLALYESYFKHDAEFLLNQRVDTARQAHCFGSLSLEEAEADIAYAISLKQKKGWDDTTNYVCWAKEMLAYIYKHNKRYAEAQLILDEVQGYVDADTGEVDNFTTNEYYNMRSLILVETGPYEEYKVLCHKKLQWLVKAVGTSHHWTMRALAELDAAHEKNNDIEASIRLHQQFDFESNWDAFCKKEDIKSESTEGYGGILTDS